MVHVNFFISMNLSKLYPHAIFFHLCFAARISTAYCKKCLVQKEVFPLFESTCVHLIAATYFFILWGLASTHSMAAAMAYFTDFYHNFSLRAFSSRLKNITVSNCFFYECCFTIWSWKFILLLISSTWSIVYSDTPIWAKFLIRPDK